MKKYLVIFAVITLVTALFSGCSDVADEPDPAPMDPMETEVVVVGGGAAGLMAALELAEAGREVILLEKMQFLGGNTIISAGIIQAAGTSVQSEAGVENDTPEKFIEDLKYPDEDYLGENFTFSMIMHEGARDMVENLRGRGLEFVDFQEANQRMHIIYPELYRGGNTLISLLETQAEDAGATIMKGTEVVDLIEQDGRIIGVRAIRNGEEIEVISQAVILATGGFSSNDEMIDEYLPELSDLKSRAAAGITGDGILMAVEHGADVQGMSAGQHMFYVNPDKEVDVPLLLAFTPSIIVNEEGERFVDESIDYAAAARAAVNQPGQRGFIVFDDMVREGHPPMEKYFEMDIVTEAETMEELAEALDMPELTDTMIRYNEMANAENDEDFGRVYNLMALESPNFYAIEVEPMYYNSYGGLVIDTEGRVLKDNGEAILGLYAAGEVTGSVEVHEGLNYTSGIAQGLVFGEIAARTVVSDLLE